MGAQRRPRDGQEEISMDINTPEVKHVDKIAEYEIVGVERSVESRVFFQNRYWDLDRLSEDEVKHLRKFPSEFPYIK